jgi:hypothetical protein
MVIEGIKPFKHARTGVKRCARHAARTSYGQEIGMGSPADYTIIVLAVAIGVGLWTLLDRVGQLQRDVEAIKRKLGANEPPADGG